MSARSIYSKTMVFCWYKLLIGLATVLISAALFGIIVGIGSLFGEDGGGIGIIIWLCATGVVRFALMHYFGYMIKAGHIAVIATAVSSGKVPDNPLDVGKRMVKERFVTANVYFAVDGLVSGAVKQLQNVLDKAGNFFGGVPGIDAVMNVGKLFISISLGYIDECCLGYTFVKKEQSAFKSAADGVVIYAQNWKKLLKDAAKTTAVVIASVVVVTLIIFLFFGLLFRAFNWNLLVAFILAAFLAYGIKFAFIDSWILAKMMTSYMGAVPGTVISFDLYGKLCGLSAKFKELFQKGQDGNPQAVYAGAGEAAATSESAVGKTVSGEGMVYCGQCGAANASGGMYCGGCGAKL